MPERWIDLTLLMVAASAVIVGFVTSSEPQVQNVLHVASMGIVVSTIFYFIVVWVPAWRHKRRIHLRLQKAYDTFRSECIAEFLDASQPQSYPRQARKALLQQEEFRRYFKIIINSDDNQTRWQVVLDKLHDSDLGTLQDILHRLEVLREEILYVLNHIDVHDEEVFVFFNRLSQNALYLKDVNRTPNSYQIDNTGGFLWEIFTGWSIEEGYRKYDIVQSMIDRI